MPHVNKQMLSFFLTTKCNLCCTYCYNVEERNKIAEQTLPLEIAKAGIDWYFSNNASRHIRFYGPGEPTYEFELMRDIADYARKAGGSGVTAEVQTNGIFDENIRKWLLDNINNIWMSFDGLPDIQNKVRPLNPKYKMQFSGRTSAEIIEENTRYLIANKDNRKLMIGARVTMTNDNIHRQKEMVDYFLNMGILHVWTNPLFPSVGQISVKDTPEKLTEYKFDMQAYLDNYIEAYKYAKTKGLFWGSFLIINFDGDCSYHCRACTPTPHLTPDGYLSACDLVLLGKDAHHMEPFVYGKWNDLTKRFDVFEDRVKLLQNRCVENMNHCQKCPAKHRCAGYCLGEVLNETGILQGQKHMACLGVKRLFNELGKLDKFDYMHP